MADESEQLSTVNFEEIFKQTLAKWLEQNGRVAKPVIVTSYEEELYQSGGCETCAFEEVIVTIRYTDGGGYVSVYGYYGSMAELIKELGDV